MLNIIKKTKKSKKWEYGDERYENLSETEKQMLVEYRKKILRNGKINKGWLNFHDITKKTIIIYLFV